MKNIWRSVALFVAALLLCAIIGEGTVRMLYSRIADYNLEMWRYARDIKVRTPDPKLPFVQRPNRKGQFFGVEIATNSFGFRDREYPVPRVPGRQRIVLLGDSFALGWGVPFEATFSKQLERLLNEHDQPTEVINLGVGNYNTAMEVELFRQKGLQFAPDIAVLMYYANDAEPTPRVLSRLKASVLTRSYLLALLLDRYIQWKPVVDRGAGWENYYASLYRKDAPGYAADREALRQLIALCRARGITLYIASIPELRDLQHYPFPQITAFVRGVAAQDAVRFVDLLPAMANETPASLWVAPGDPHASAKANGIIARELFRTISGDHSAHAAQAATIDSTSTEGGRSSPGRGVTTTLAVQQVACGRRIVCR